MTDIKKKLLDAIKPLAEAIDCNDGDTVGQTRPDNEVILVGEGSWTGNQKVTLGDLRRIVAAYEELLREE